MGRSVYPFVDQRRDVCRTPGAVYSTAFGPALVRLDVAVPAPLFHLSEADQQELVRDFHAAILPVMERLYRERWPLLAGATIDGSEMPATWEELEPAT